MRIHAWMLGAAVLPLAAVLCAMTVADEDVIPQCTCSGMGSWVVSNPCGGTQCRDASLISNSLSCAAATPGPCPVTGSVTVTYNGCTTVVCAQEHYTSCSSPCDGPVLDHGKVNNGGSVGPSVDACCETGCTWNFDLRFYSAGTTCPAGAQHVLHCHWNQQFQCKPT